MPPKVAHALRSRQTELRPRHGDFLRGLREVEEAYRTGAIGEILYVNLFATVDDELRGLLAEFILIDREHLVVGEEAEGEVIGLLQRTTDEQRRGEEAPE